MSALSRAEPADFGLRIGAEPVRKIKPKTARKTMPGDFPTIKGTLPSLRTETQHEWDGLAQFEINPDCVLMASQPHHLIYHQRKPGGGSVMRSYTPDVAILMWDGRIVVVDFKIAEYAEHPRWAEKKALLEEIYARDHDVVFQTITEQMTRIEPRRTNAAIMCQHRLGEPDEEAHIAVRSAIAHIGLPATIGEVSRLAKLTHPLKEVDRAYTMLINMALQGEVALDLGIPLGIATMVMPRTSQRAGD